MDTSVASMEGRGSRGLIDSERVGKILFIGSAIVVLLFAIISEILLPYKSATITRVLGERIVAGKGIEKILLPQSCSQEETRFGRILLVKTECN